MKKTLLTIASIGLSVCAMAQTNGRLVKNSGIFATTTLVQQSITAGSTSILCDTLTTLTTTSLSIGGASSDTTTPGCSPKAGYVFGSNCYQDEEKANFFNASLYSNQSGATVSGVIVGFYQSGTKGTGGTPTTTVGMTLYSGTNATTTPGSVIGSTVATLGAITAAHTSTTNLFYYTFNFATPLAIPATGGFFASLVVPITAGDTAVVYNQYQAPTNLAWEKQSGGIWADMSVSWGSATKGNLLFLPKICGTNVTGISENLGLSSNVTILPNPTTGLVNVAVILQDKENLNVTVSNTLGQVLVNNKYDGISNDLLSLDLSGFNNGVYFVTVSNGKDKMVQRLVLSK
jgi:hypothetical protein